VDLAPDIFLKMQDYSYITRGGSEFGSNELFDFPEVRHSGNHRPEGIFLFSGPAVRNQREIGVAKRAQLQDLLPTMLYLFDLPIPEALDGRVLHEMLTLGHEECRYQGNIYREEIENKNSIDFAPEVRKRLEGMGYL
jgi:predicted AlkP superfamily phosphohydrolase/phosphomutase